METEPVHISEAARRLGVTAHYLRILEAEGKVPSVRRDLNGRVYSEFDLALLRAVGVGQRPTRLRKPEDVLAEGSR